MTLEPRLLPIQLRMGITSNRLITFALLLAGRQLEILRLVLYSSGKHSLPIAFGIPISSMLYPCAWGWVYIETSKISRQSNKQHATDAKGT
jgi:hypothetical protein